MTASSPAPPRIAATLPDVRCAATLGEPSPEQGRCQLFIGHESPHAVLYCGSGQRVVRTWRRGAPGSAQDDAAEITRLPWMFGYPVPAWSDLED